MGGEAEGGKGQGACGVRLQAGLDPWEGCCGEAGKVRLGLQTFSEDRF